MTDIAELFERDPLLLTKEDRRAMIVYYRDNRAKFIATGKSPRAPKKPLPEGGLSLDDLEL